MAVPEHIVEACARAAHEANRAYSVALGDFSHAPWEHAPEWQRASSRKGVVRALEGATSEQLHDSWLNDKVHDGWRYGVVKDLVAKTHPCMVRYSALPEQERRKDALYAVVVRAVADALSPKTTAAAEDRKRVGPMTASVEIGHRLGFIAHAVFCPTCTSFMAAPERRRELEHNLIDSIWRCEEGRKLAKLAEG